MPSEYPAAAWRKGCERALRASSRDGRALSTCGDTAVATITPEKHQRERRRPRQWRACRKHASACAALYPDAVRWDRAPAPPEEERTNG